MILAVCQEKSGGGGTLLSLPGILEESETEPSTLFYFKNIFKATEAQAKQWFSHKKEMHLAFGELI